MTGEIETCIPRGQLRIAASMVLGQQSCSEV
jgi:hypothetical protein